MVVDICAGWLPVEEKIGELKISRSHGKEILAVVYDKNWLKVHQVMLDPDLSLTYPGRSVLLMIMQKIEALGQHSEAKSIPNRNQSVFIHGVTPQGAGICRLFFRAAAGKEERARPGKGEKTGWEMGKGGNPVPAGPGNGKKWQKKPSKI